MRALLLLASLLVGVACVACPASAQESFRGKTISMIVGTAPGGGTDTTGRLLAPFLTRYLPGNPPVVVHNIPGADGIVALNYFVQQIKPDGLTITIGDSPGVDPLRYRSPQSHYDPIKFEYFGGIDRGGTMIVINGAAEKRLTNKAAAPITMGVAATIPRSGQLIAAWGIAFLDWNAKWILGYRGQNELMLA